MCFPFRSEVFHKKLWLSFISDEWLFQKNCELGREFLAFGEYMGRWSRRMSSSKAFIRSLFDCPVGVDFFCYCFFVNLVASYLLSFNVCLPEMIKVHRQLGATYQINIYQFNISLQSATCQMTNLSKVNIQNYSCNSIAIWISSYSARYNTVSEKKISNAGESKVISCLVLCIFFVDTGPWGSNLPISFFQCIRLHSPNWTF